MQEYLQIKSNTKNKRILIQSSAFNLMPLLTKTKATNRTKFGKKKSGKGVSACMIVFLLHKTNA